MRIGSHEFILGAALAPMAGVTDAPARLLAYEMGAAYAVSEMLSAKGYLCAPQGARAIADLTRRLPGEGVGGLQLFGREPKFMEEAARRLSDAGYQFIDVNMGCPAHKIVGNGEGSALMREPLLAGHIVEAAVRGASVPVTVKMRSGWDEEHINAPEIARICQESGASAVCVHPRTREQQYAGRADIEVIARVKRSVSIPVIGNGDVERAEDEARLRALTGCDFVMVGRGALGNPWIFREIRALQSGQTACPPTPEERVSFALWHAETLVSLKGEACAMREMRKHFAWYMRGLPGSAKLRVAMNEVETLNAAKHMLYEFLARAV